MKKIIYGIVVLIIMIAFVQACEDDSSSNENVKIESDTNTVSNSDEVEMGNDIDEKVEKDSEAVEEESGEETKEQAEENEIKIKKDINKIFNSVSTWGKTEKKVLKLKEFDENLVADVIDQRLLLLAEDEKLGYTEITDLCEMFKEAFPESELIPRADIIVEQYYKANNWADGVQVQSETELGKISDLESEYALMTVMEKYNKDVYLCYEVETARSQIEDKIPIPKDAKIFMYYGVTYLSGKAFPSDTERGLLITTNTYPSADGYNIEMYYTGQDLLLEDTSGFEYNYPVMMEMDYTRQYEIENVLENYKDDVQKNEEISAERKKNRKELIKLLKKGLKG